MTRNEFLLLVVASPLAILFGKKIHSYGKSWYILVTYPCPHTIGSNIVEIQRYINDYCTIHIHHAKRYYNNKRIERIKQ